MKNIFKLFIAVFLISSCDKEEKNIHKFAGVFNIESTTVDYYKNGAIDSTVTMENPGSIGLYDNGRDFYNSMIYALEQQPKGWTANLVGDGGYTIYWYTTPRGKHKTVSFYSDASFYSRFVVYTIENSKRNGKMDWVYVHTDADKNIEWVETLKVKRQK